MESTVAPVTTANYCADYQPHMVRSIEQMLAIIDHNLDA